jgi:hypothetical protein
LFGRAAARRRRELSAKAASFPHFSVRFANFPTKTHFLLQKQLRFCCISYAKKMCNALATVAALVCPVRARGYFCDIPRALPSANMELRFQRGSVGRFATRYASFLISAFLIQIPENLKLTSKQFVPTVRACSQPLPSQLHRSGFVGGLPGDLSFHLRYWSLSCMD